MPLPCILGGFDPKAFFFFFFFFSDFCNQGTKGGQGKIGNFAEKSGKIGEIWYNRLLVEISYRSPSITEISMIFRSKFQKFCSLDLPDIATPKHTIYIYYCFIQP